MRKIIFLFFLNSINLTFGQEIQQVEIIKSDKQVTELFNEIGEKELKLDIIDLLSQPALNIGYEKIIDPYASYGADIFLSFNSDNMSRSWSEQFSLNPYYRFYFLNKTDFGGEGYFAEVFIKFSNIKYDRNTYIFDPMPNEPYSTTEEIKAWDIAPGVGIGRKWVNKRGWTFEYMIGFGRYIFAGNDNEDVPNDGDNYSISEYRPNGSFKGGISIGKRF